MNPKNNPMGIRQSINLLVFSMLPQGLAIPLCLMQARWEDPLRRAIFWVLIGIWGAFAALSMVYALWKRRAAAPQRLLLALIIQGLVTFVGMMTLTYPMPRYTHLFNLEVTLLFLLGVQMAGLCCMLLHGRREESEAQIKRMLGYGFFLPLICSLTFSIWTSVNAYNDILLAAGIGLMCLAGLFFIRWMMCGRATRENSAEPDAEEPAPTEEEATKPATPFYERAWFIVIFAVILPIVGLKLNQQMGCLFLDASHSAFYILALLNGLSMMPPIKKMGMNLPYLFVRAVCVLYLAYFVILFLPYTVMAFMLIPIGFGLIMLTPGILLWDSIAQLVDLSGRLLKKHSASAVGATIAAGVLLLPLILGGNMLMDRFNYEQAMVEQARNVSKAESRVDIGRLSRTLSNMNGVNDRFERRSDFLSFDHGGEVPILSEIYKDVVYGGQPLPYSSVQMLYTTHYLHSTNTKAHLPDLSSWGITQNTFALLAPTVHTEFDSASGTYLSWINLTIEDRTTGSFLRGGGGNNEFTATFTLPEGSFIVDYSLYVGAENKRGILAEKQAAELIYDRVVSTQKDPGLLRYLDGDRVELKVSPFSPGQVRRTSFRVMHIEPITLLIGGVPVSLDAPERDDLHVPGIDMGEHGMDCLPGQCAEPLTYRGNAYDDALALIHNSRIELSDTALVAEAFKQHVLSPRTAFIVLETAEQEAEMLMLQQRILNGEEIPKRFVSMDEPGGIALIAIAVMLIGLMIIRRRRPALAQ